MIDTLKRITDLPRNDHESNKNNAWNKNENQKTYLNVFVPFKSSTEEGMPAMDEIYQLLELEEEMKDSMEELGGSYVGRVNYGDYWLIYFDIDGSKSSAEYLIAKLAKSFKYKIMCQWIVGAEITDCRCDLVKMTDEDRIVQDILLIDELAKSGDKPDEAHEIYHYTYFLEEENATLFLDWLKESDENLLYARVTQDNNEFLVHYGHYGTLNLGDISQYSLHLSRKARELTGLYEGWVAKAVISRMTGIHVQSP